MGRVVCVDLPDSVIERLEVLEGRVRHRSRQELLRAVFTLGLAYMEEAVKQKQVRGR
jgi:hypothetical protein